MWLCGDCVGVAIPLPKWGPTTTTATTTTITTTGLVLLPLPLLQIPLTLMNFKLTPSCKDDQ